MTDIFCRTCGDSYAKWESQGQKMRLMCDTCIVIHGGRKIAPKHCQLCGTTESPQWRTWRSLHACNACGIKMWRYHDVDYYSQPYIAGGGHVTKNELPTDENFRWAEKMMSKLTSEEE